MFRDTSPTFGLTHFLSGHAPPSPPGSFHDALDDVYGSKLSSPNTDPQELLSHDAPAYEILSDLPSRQRALDTDAYREGLSNSKGQYVQEGFDEGYSLGANIGQRIGYILGILQGCVDALQGHDDRAKEAADLLAIAKKELAIQEIFGKDWIDEEGMWRWDVQGNEDDVTFREVASQHPVVQKWLVKVDDLTKGWGVNLQAPFQQDDSQKSENS